MWNRNRMKRALMALSVAALSVLALITVQAAGDSKKSISAEVPAYTAVVDINSNRYTKPEKLMQTVNILNLEGYTKIMQDASLEIWHKEKNSSIRVVDRKSGYVWGGLSEEKPENMNSTWSGIGNSLLTIDYFDNKGLEKRLSIADKQVEKEYTVKENIFHYDVNFQEIGIALAFEVALKDGTITFQLKEDGIKETKNYMLGAIYFVPFLGTTLEDKTDGYMFVPDGPGALIRLNKPSQYLVTFNKMVYGKDYGIENLLEVNDLKSERPNDFATEEPTVMMPVFGMVHGTRQNGFFANIEKGAEYAAIMATPSGTLTPYNWVCAKFIYRQKYLQPTSKSGAGVQIVQKEKNRYDAQISYNFLSGKDADYVGMAKFYRELLIRTGDLPAKERQDQNIPIQLDILASDIEKGYLFNNTLKITTPEQIKTMAEELKSNGIPNITLVVKGWQKGGYNGNKPSSFDFEKVLGGEKAIRQLADQLEKAGVSVYFADNPITANETQLDLRKEGGNSLSQALIKTQRDNDSLWFKDTYFIKAGKAADYVMNRAAKYAERDMKGMALEEFGSKLYAENQKDNVITRSEVRKKFENAAEKAGSEVERFGVYAPNQYLWKYLDDAFAVPMVNSQYLFETDTVPFMQIVLKGSLDYFAPFSNQSFSSRLDVLKLIEYGAYPSFILTALNNYELGYTPVSELYSTNYEDWKQYISEIYSEVNSALKETEGRRIDDRTVLSAGVVKVSYEGGVSIIVNYTSNAYSDNNVKVPAQNFAVIKGRS